ncbi:MAG: S-layer homology domain-containing protein [Flavonifractor plautii]
MAENPELLALYAEAYGEESQEPAEPAYLNTREHDAYIQGNDGRFRPEDSLSRAEAVAMLARLSVDEQGNLLYSGAPGTGGFSDVKRGDWYAPYVTFAKRYGIANGYLDGTFRPEQPVSRAELVKLIASYFTVEGGTSPFPDVPDGHWAAEVVSFAAEEGWVSGYPDGTFRPDAPVSRAEAVKILNHALDRRAGSGPRPCPLPTWRRATGPAMRSGRRRSPHLPQERRGRDVADL